MSKDSKGPALIIGFGKPKKGAARDEEDDDDMPPESGEGVQEDEESDEGDELGMHADAMFDALQDGDKAAFKEALRKCLMASDEGAYGGEE